MTTNYDEHEWFSEQIATYLSGGLIDPAERERFETHAQICPSCAAELKHARAMESKMSDLFGMNIPANDFEERLANKLRFKLGKRHWAHPQVRKAAVAAAMVLMLGGAGYVAQEYARTGELPSFFPQLNRAREIASPRYAIGPERQVAPTFQIQEDLSAQTSPTKSNPYAINGIGTLASSGTAELLHGESSNFPKQGPSGSFQFVDGLTGAARSREGIAQPNATGRQDALNKNTGTVALQNRNTFTGNTTVSNGTLSQANFDTKQVGQPNFSRGNENVFYSAQGAQDATAGERSAAGAGAGGGGRGGRGGSGASFDNNLSLANNYKPAAAAAAKPETVALAQSKDEEAGAGGRGSSNMPALQVTQGTTSLTVPISNTNSGPTSQPAASARRVIREGTMEFEVESFDSTFTTIATIVGEEGGFIAAADSDKLPNGKVRGMVTVRVPPDRLDLLVLKLRALGELKSQKLGSRDVGKEYTDLESELRAARAMESRLLEMIAKAQGKVADLLEAERELSNWRTKIEKITGTLNYYNNLISMATLTINAYEKDIRTPASANISEEITAGVETDDVETSRNAALKAIDDAKGRIIESNLQKLEAGQFAAKIVAEVSPENAGPIIDRLKQLGRLARYDVQKKQTTDPNRPVTQNGRPANQAPVHLETVPTRIIISMYNLANVAPRLTTNLNLAGDEVEGVYRAILKRVADANGRVISSNLNHQDAAQVTGAIQFEVKAADADAVLNDIRQQALVLRLNVTENPDTANVTTAKQAFTLQIIPTAQLTPKLSSNLNLAAEDVEGTYNNILKMVSASAGARIVNSSLNRQNATQAVGSIQFEVKADQAATVLNEIRKNVQVLSLNVTENADNGNVTSIKQGFSLQIISTAQVQPREVRTLSIQTSQVEAAMQAVNATVIGSGGRIIDSSLNQDTAGPTVARMVVEIPLDKTDQVSDAMRKQGTVRSSESSRNNQIPDGPLARTRINLTISTAETIVPSEGGFAASIREGLTTSVKGLLWSLQLIVIGVCLVAPWALLIWGGWKFAKKRRSVTTQVP